MTRSAACLVVVLAAGMAAADPVAPGPRQDATLARGGFSGIRGGSHDPQAGPRADDGRLGLRRRLLPGAPGLSPELPVNLPLPQAIGDRLILSLDDGVAPVGGDWEARLDVSGGVAGDSDAVAIRFPASALAVAPPFDVSSVILGLDDRHGATTWPVELWLEDAAVPLQPRQGSGFATSSLDAVAAGLSPTTGPRPTDFQRIPVSLRLPVPATWLSDGAFDDDFERSAVPLTNADWIECDGVACDSLSVYLSGGEAVRQDAGGAILAVRFPSAAPEALRPHRDIDVRASVRVVDSAPGFSRAGLALRILAADAFYRVEYQKTPSQVVVSAVLPAPTGTVAIGMPLPVATPSSGSRLLEVTVTGASPAVRFDISLDGVPLGTIQDPLYRLTGWYSGLSASDAAGQGEAWDDFRVERRPDVFAVIGFPPGEDVGLPLDVSDLSLVSQSVLVSSDGVSFSPAATAVGCFNPGNPFVQLEVEDSVTGSQLFQREAQVIALDLDCPTCPVGPAACARNLGVSERSVPTLVTGEPVTARVSWWNGHLADSSLMFRGTLWTGPCENPGVIVASATVTGITSFGQGSPGTSQVDVLTFDTTIPGPHCLTVEELHDANGDCCPDGEETTPLGGCGGACTPIPPSDSQPGTRWTLLDLLAEAPCSLPIGEDVGRDGPDDLDSDGFPDEINLDGSSLRVARGPGEVVFLTWDRNDPVIFPAVYNLHLVDASTFHEGACFLAQAPVVYRVVGVTATAFDLPVSQGRPAWFAVHETDGCASGASIVDESADDPALACP